MEDESFAVHSPASFKCELCSRVLLSERAFLFHSKRHKCSHCGEKYPKPVDLQLHIRKEHRSIKKETTTFSTTDDQSFVLDSDLSERRNDNLPENKCYICLCQFGSEYQLQTHNKIHKGEQLHPCKFCTRQFTTASLFTLHLNKEHSNEHLDPRTGDDVGAVYVCPYCGETFHSRVQLRRHSDRKHFNHNSFACKFCGRCFDDAVALDNHVKLHKVTGKFVCDLCPKTFSQKTGLVFHMKNHQEI